MDLIIIRHGLAGDRDVFAKTGLPDTERPLTKKGQTEFRALAKIYKKILPQPDLILTSPLVRTFQTAEILKRSYKDVEFETADPLKPDGSSKALEALLKLKGKQYETVFLVGHEPDLGQHINFFLTGASRSLCDLKKGGLFWIRFSESVQKGEGKIKCCLQPAQVRKLLKK